VGCSRARVALGSGPPDRLARRRAGKRRRARVRMALGAALALVAAAAGASLWSSGRGASHSAPRLPKASHAAAAAPRLHPPGPIPGYLLIADRGNNRMLLVNSSKHIFWQYPKPGVTPAMPFRFDDDTFFGPQPNRIIS